MCDLYLGPPRKTEIPDFYKRESDHKELDVVEVYHVVMQKNTNIDTGEERLTSDTLLLGRAMYTKPEPDYDLSFSTRYAYDKVNLLNRDKTYVVQYHSQIPEFPPWRQRFEQWLKDPKSVRETEEVMEDNEPHYLLQDQAGYTGTGPDPYPRKINLPETYQPKNNEDEVEEHSIIIELPFLTDDLANLDCCMDDHDSHCNF